MAKESIKARERKRRQMVEKYADKRAELKAKGDYVALQKLPRNASPVRLRNRCAISGRPRGYIRYFGISRIEFRQLASKGLIPGVKKLVGNKKNSMLVISKASFFNNSIYKVFKLYYKLLTKNLNLIYNL